MPDPKAKVMASTGRTNTMDEAMRRFCVTARICNPIGERLSSVSSAKKTPSVKMTIHMRFQVIVSPPSSKAPGHPGRIANSRLFAPKMERTACCRMSEIPQVASSVSSGRP